MCHHRKRSNHQHNRQKKHIEWNYRHKIRHDIGVEYLLGKQWLKHTLHQAQHTFHPHNVVE
jgi:hypothetical protein